MFSTSDHYYNRTNLKRKANTTKHYLRKLILICIITCIKVSNIDTTFLKDIETVSRLRSDCVGLLNGFNVKTFKSHHRFNVTLECVKLPQPIKV